MDPKKVQTILDWETPTSVRDVQYFLGFANFDRIFIQGYSKVATPLTRLTGHPKFVWDSEAAKAFQALKQAFTTAPILIHADPTKPFILETDTSDFALGAILSQVGDDGRVHPVAFHSRKFLAAEINYEIHDKELLAIVDSFETWRHLLEGAPHKITVYTDHKNLEYFMASRVLNRRQARWSGILSRFDSVISYRPGHQQGKPDALSRRSYLAPKEGDASFDQQESVILKPEQLKLNAIISNAPEDSTFLTKVRKQTARDPRARNIRRQLQGQGDLNEDFSRK
ncbi:hypothetical protein L7F22_020332 [Adiantum nelumboides]|nr:hypothetical protein [Adiantum nelumboides]